MRCVGQAEQVVCIRARMGSMWVADGGAATDAVFTSSVRTRARLRV